MKTQTDKAILPNCNQNGREIRFGETVVAKVGTAATNGWTDDAIAALIVQAVNEHAALEKVAALATHYLITLDDKDAQNLTEALADVVMLREGKAAVQ